LSDGPILTQPGRQACRPFETVAANIKSITSANMLLATRSARHRFVQAVLPAGLWFRLIVVIACARPAVILFMPQMSATCMMFCRSAGEVCPLLVLTHIASLLD
jgi:hypothetical protein